MLTLDLLFTIAACSSLLVLWLASAAVLPWTESELEEVEAELVRLLPLHLFKVHDALDSPAANLCIDTCGGQGWTQRDRRFQRVGEFLVQEQGQGVAGGSSVGRVLLRVGR